jgi:hypothetical protein
VHLIGGFEEVSPQVWPGSYALIVNFQFVVSAQRLNDWSWICCDLLCSMITVAMGQKVMQIWMVIPFLCAQRLFTLYGQERRNFTSELRVFLDIIPKGILKEILILFLMDLWLVFFFWIFSSQLVDIQYVINLLLSIITKHIYLLRNHRFDCSGWIRKKREKDR